jgi:hypothetical protein
MKSVVITVGRGRGFVILDADGEPIVITAAHCLPSLPDCRRREQSRGCVYKHLLAPLREKPAIGAELLFADPVADIAVLGPPENSAAYDDLVSGVMPLKIGRVADERRTRVIKVQLLSLLDEWFTCRAVHSRGALQLHGNGVNKIVCGASGSPILAGDGRVIAVLVAIDGDPDKDVHDGVGGPQPTLIHNLPARFLP